MNFNLKPIKSASLIQSSLIQTISESEASSISGGATTKLPDGWGYAPGVRVGPLPTQIFDPSNPDHC